ncbi:unnamed protein product [Caenorhabditis bovis]|uniref:Neurotransmitter-gated ion-channel ligand-binding domain-containing protein n=1 Tax=Caenorhabditis bovis TaxID=2654633 RepID=A0A8S1F8M7_9PELO|nr:unnamed protein product [Caenorhabditis bovis]
MNLIIGNVDVRSKSYYDALSAQLKLKKDLFADYDPNVAQIRTKHGTGTVPETDRFNYTVFLYYLKLIEVKEPEDKVTFVLDIMEYWYDARLVWDPKNYSGVATLYVAQSEVWSPGLQAFGIHDIVDFRNSDFRTISVDYTGYIWDYLSLKISTVCIVDIDLFPFDVQKCQIRIDLPSFYSDEIKIINEVYEGIRTSDKLATMGNSEWIIRNLTSRIEKIIYNDSYGTMDLAVFEVIMRRNAMYYFYMIIAPSFTINLLSVFGVFMKNTDLMARLTVGLTNIMTMTFILGVMADKIPKTSSIPLLGIYILINLIIMLIAVCVTCNIGSQRKWLKSFQKPSPLRISSASYGYQFKSPPRFNYTTFLYDIKLIDVSEPEEKVTFVMELMEEWFDPRLLWNPSEFQGITSMYVTETRVWSPGLQAFSIHDMTDFRDSDFRLVMITNFGRISTYMSLKISTTCSMDIAEFPFDEQICQIRLCIPLFNRDEVQLINEIYQGILKANKISKMGNAEWVVKNLSGKVETLEYDDDFGSLELSIFEVRIKRNPMYYIYMIIIPSFIINFLSIIGVLMKGADLMSRLTVGLTNIMTMTFIMGVIADQIPKAGTIPLLGIYILANLVIVLIATAITASMVKVKEFILLHVVDKKSFLT